MKSVLLSRDIILDYILDGEEKSLESIEVVKLCIEGGVKGWILEETISKVYSLCSQTIDRNEVVKRIKGLLEFLSILPLNKESILRTLSGSYQDYEKIIQVEAARSAKLDFLVTTNVSDYKEGNIKILTPGELLDKLVNEEVNSIPALDLKPELHTFWDDVQGELGKLAFSTNFILGDSVKKFEERFAGYCKAEHCVGVASGSD